MTRLDFSGTPGPRGVFVPGVPPAPALWRAAVRIGLSCRRALYRQRGLGDAEVNVRPWAGDGASRNAVAGPLTERTV